VIVVIDTSVWVSALQFAGRATPPILAVEKALRKCTLATTAPINVEIRRILMEKFLWRPEDAKRIIGSYFEKALAISITGDLRECRDPNDDMVLECAVVAGAAMIISGDKDLLVLNPYEGIRILTAAEFLAAEV
jgi:putative PIN family toxin of toxin-antitoxin system